MNIIVNPQFAYFAGQIYWLQNTFADNAVNLVHIDDLQRGKYDERDPDIVETTAASILPIKPVSPDPETVRCLWRLDKTPCQLVKEGRYPFKDISDVYKYVPAEDDFLHFIDSACDMESVDQLGLWAEAFHDFIAFPENLEFFNETGYMSSFLFYSIMMIFSFEDENEGVKRSLAELKKVYTACREDPFSLMPEDSYYLDILFLVFDVYMKSSTVTSGEREKYIKRLDSKRDCCDPLFLEVYADSYYNGYLALPVDYKKAEYAYKKIYKMRMNRMYDESYFVHAARYLGHIYYDCENTEHDYKKAMSYFAYATSKSDCESALCLSDMYFNGTGVLKAPEISFEILMKLDSIIGEDDYLFPDVAIRLGRFYRDGIVVPKDLVKAGDYFGRAKMSMMSMLENRGENCCFTSMDEINEALKSI